jgi:hypothetical protein
VKLVLKIKIRIFIILSKKAKIKDIHNNSISCTGAEIIMW